MPGDPFNLKLKADRPVYRQIAELLRKKIVAGTLPPGTRLPAIGELAQRWNTNYFTVQSGLVRLVNEGLLESSPRTGTFVRSARVSCKSVGLYFGANFWGSLADSFYSMLFGILCERFLDLKIATQLWIDPRPRDQQGTPLPAILRAIEKRKIQGVIAPLINNYDTPWLHQLAVPVVFGSHEEPLSAVSSDWNQLISQSLKRFKAQGCESVGIITHVPQLAKMFQEKARRLRLTTSPEWIKISEEGQVSGAIGSALFKELWSGRKHPDALLVYPDVLAHGVMVAILEKQLRVPDDLKAIFHMNAELAYYCPVPVELAVTRITAFADRLIESVRSQVEGAPAPSKVAIPFEWMTAAEMSTISSF